MTRKSKDLQKKLKEYRKKPVVSKKDERKIRRKVRKFRKLMRAQQEASMKPHYEWLETELEHQRIIKEVEEEERAAKEEGSGDTI